MYSYIVEEIENYNNIYDMKDKFNKLIINFNDIDELIDFKNDIKVAIMEHKKSCNEKDEDCDFMLRYNYGINKIDNKIIKLNGDINKNTIIINTPTESNISKVWWFIIIPIIVGLIIFGITNI